MEDETDELKGKMQRLQVIESKEVREYATHLDDTQWQQYIYAFRKNELQPLLHKLSQPKYEPIEIDAEYYRRLLKKMSVIFDNAQAEMFPG